MHRERPPVRLELAGCLDLDRDSLQRAVRVEVGDLAGPEDPGAVTVRVDCATGDRDAGVVLDVRRPDSGRGYRYALDWRAQPLDARPRLLGLAVAEAVDASQIELTALPEPVIDRAIGALQPRAPSDWSVALVGSQRRFAGPRGVGLLGAGLSPSRRLSRHLRLSGDLLAETTTVVTSSGGVSVQSLSAASYIVARAGTTLHGELGLGVRAGLVRMRGEAAPFGHLVATDSLVRGWLGPAAMGAVGADLGSTVAIDVRFELGIAGPTTTARDVGEPVATLGGTWRSLGVAIAIAL